MDLQLLISAVVGVNIFAVAVIIVIERRQPSTTMAWLLTLLFLPGIGLVLFLLIGTTSMRRVARRSAAAAARISEVLATHGVGTMLDGSRPSELEPRTEALLKLGETLASTPASHLLSPLL